MFAPIESPRTSTDKCADALRASILRGELEPGTRLPPERRLAESFGVNRVTVRSALGRLAAAGLLSVRQGSGYVVQDFEQRGGPDLLPALIKMALQNGQGAEVLSDLLFVRRHLARALLERLFDTATEADLVPVQSAIDAFAVAIDRGASPQALAQADLDVISALLDATHSAVMRLCLNPLVALVSRMPRLQAAVYAQPALNVAGWRLLLQALRDGDREALENLLGALRERDEDALRAFGGMA